MKLYSTPGCPMCQMLAQKMNEKNIKFEKVMDLDVLEEKNITHVPVLETDDGRLLNLPEALKYVTAGE